ncbi:hypothetical protein MBM_08358 [Drepanopeziza brunnea f. sp. 'multigermtubi' MB_m1]|uniref:Uncharacterized protein n=2 Tax=Drepanopeziza brunnea f. sp. 'multigermtubi' TaxID=698441 RepID=K1W8Z6_MARBU|nr:uncharacterized protein MBM_08358 [Drepanopeziza brunnea f. sp. 'multigermtubi' MB_m1]EKD13640.1 hypothetical protein MBM_08358 [Drepanopeziza brunnea f. sp. 'multigermtubi' MB_m1]
MASAFPALIMSQIPLATVYPCSSCPSSIAPAAITVTSQYQTVSTCTPHTVPNTVSGTPEVEPDCTPYAWLSTVIRNPGGSANGDMGGSQLSTITRTEQVVQVSYTSTVLTSEYPCATTTPSYRRKSYEDTTSCASTKSTTMVVDVSCPFKEIGPLAIEGYPGSGLCTTCAEDKNGVMSQIVTATKCLDESCSTYLETWVLAKPTTTTSVSSALFSSSTFCPTSGTYTIPVTATWTPSGPVFTQLATERFEITTAVPITGIIQVATIIEVTFTGTPAATACRSTIVSGITKSPVACPTGVASTSPSYTNSGPADAGPEKRNVQADMVVSENAAHDSMIRRGGMLRSVETKDLKNVMASVTSAPEDHSVCG